MLNKTKIALTFFLFSLLLFLVACNSARNADLEGSEWVLKSINDVSLPVEYTITLVFEENIARSGGMCNNYSAGYGILRDNRIFITPKALSSRVCFDPPGFMETEVAFIAVLGEVSRYEREGGELQLTTELGDVLVFSEAP